MTTWSLLRPSSSMKSRPETLGTSSGAKNPGDAPFSGPKGRSSDPRRRRRASPKNNRPGPHVAGPSHTGLDAPCSGVEVLSTSSSAEIARWQLFAMQ